MFYEEVYYDRIVGNMSKKQYAWGALSANDPNQTPFGYNTKEEAQAFADRMNVSIDTWEENPKGLWNKDYWKVKPDPLYVVKLR